MTPRLPYVAVEINEKSCLQTTPKMDEDAEFGFFVELESY